MASLIYSGRRGYHNVPDATTMIVLQRGKSQLLTNGNTSRDLGGNNYSTTVKNIMNEVVQLNKMEKYICTLYQKRFAIAERVSQYTYYI